MKNKYKLITLIIMLNVFIISFIVIIWKMNFYPKKNIVVMNSNKDIVDKELNNDFDENNSFNSVLEQLRKTYNNDEVVGLLKIDNTSILEPVMQGENNSYYLNHTEDKKYEIHGSIYMDYRNNLIDDKKILIYGHSSYRKNLDIVPFNELENYYNKDFYDTHKYINLTLDKEIRTYEIFSVYVETSDFTYMNLNFDSSDSWYQHILKLKKKSLYDTSVDVTPDSQIIILQTCSNNSKYKNYKDKYLLVIGKKIETKKEFWLNSFYLNIEKKA